MGKEAIVAAALFVFACPAMPFDDAVSGITSAKAEQELFACRYESASALYARLAVEQPKDGDLWYGLVKSQIESHHSQLAYASAEEGLAKAPQTAGAETAAGIAMFRRGNLSKAEEHFRAALKINPDYAPGLSGLASIYATVSKPKSARELNLNAYRQSPDNPELMRAYANTLKGSAHVAALEAAYSKMDPSAEEAKHLRVHIANDRALGDRKLRRLVSPYQPNRIKLSLILEGPKRPRGVALKLLLNQKQTVKLLLDTGASGISVSPKIAAKAGLDVISGDASEAKGIGDKKPMSEIAYLASEIRAGDVVFADFPISVFRSAQTPDYDGLIGADVFARFLVKIDFPDLELSLEPRKVAQEDDGEPVDAAAPGPGFFRAFRFGNHLAVSTMLAGGRPGTHSALFLLDSGASINLIDTEMAKEVTTVSNNAPITVTGIQGKVEKTSMANRVMLTFAGFRQEVPDLVAISLEKMDDSLGVGLGGVLGMPILRSLAMTIDYRDGTVRFDYKKP